MTPEQFAKWEPAREAHHKQTIVRDKQRDAAPGKKPADAPPPASAQ